MTEQATARVVNWADRKHEDTGEPDPRQEIIVLAGNLHQTVDAAERALLAMPDHGVYQRGGKLVRVARLERKIDGAIRRDSGSPIVVELEAPTLDVLLSKAALWLKIDPKKQQPKPCDVPSAISKALLANKGNWSAPPLSQIVSCPTMRPDGSIFDVPGYDAETGLLYVGDDGGGCQVPDRPTLDDARAALAALCEPYKEFRFVQDADRAVFVAAILTALVRPIIRTAPLFAFTAPVPGSGKTKLAECVTMIATGGAAPAIRYVDDGEEMRKRLFAILKAGDSVALLDNVETVLQGETLCSMLTSEAISDRPLHQSAMETYSTALTLLATGNNLTVKGDLVSRTLMCRIDPGVEHPENRDFNFDPLKLVQANRFDHVRAALTILRAFHVAGRPAHRQPVYGRFEQWDGLIRGGLLWVGMADPCATRDAVQAEDEVTGDLEAVMAGWAEKYQDREVSASQVAAEMNPAAQDHPFRQALLAVARVQEGQNVFIGTKRLGKWLAKSRDRIVKNRRIVSPRKVDGTILWAVRQG